MYKIYFDNRVITICAKNELDNIDQSNVLFCKSKKSFDNAYNLFLTDLSTIELIVHCDDPKELFKHLKGKYSVIKAAGGIVLNAKDELLIIKRNGYWDLPKGKIEKGEGKRIAAVREVEEECGISDLSIVAKIYKTYHNYQFKGKEIFKVTHWYIMKYSGVETLAPQIEEGITEVKWITKSEINSLLDNTYESLKPLFLSVVN